MFISTRNNQKSVTSLTALLYPTSCEDKGVFCPRNLSFFDPNSLQSLSDEDIFVKIFHKYLSEVFSASELKEVYFNAISKFKDGSFFSSKAILSNSLISFCNGPSGSYRDVPFAILSELFLLYQKKYLKKLHILHIGDELDFLSFRTFFASKDFKTLFLCPKIESKFAMYSILNGDAAGVFQLDNQDLSPISRIRDDVYFHDFLNESCSFSTVDDYNYFYILSFTFVFILLKKIYKYNFTCSFCDSNLTFSLAAQAANIAGFEVKKVVSVFFKNDIFVNIINKSLLKNTFVNFKQDGFSLFYNNANLVNLERILFSLYEFDSGAINRLMSLYKQGGECFLNIDIAKKIDKFFASFNLEDSVDLIRNISSIILSESKYIDQYTSASIAGSNILKNSIGDSNVLCFELFDWSISVDFISKIMGFQINSEVPWSSFQADRKVVIPAVKADTKSIGDKMLEIFI